MSEKLNRDEQLERLRWRYGQRGKEAKGRLLDEFCEQYGYERKYGIRLLTHAQTRPKHPPPGPQPKYEGILEVVERIWSAAEQLCGKRLACALPLWLPHYERHFGKLLPRQKKLTREISAATLDRLLRARKGQALRRFSGTKPGTLLRQQVPIQGEVWQEGRVGFLEADSVAHCGNTLAGSFIWSLTYTDLASSWTEGRAVWNKGATGVLERTREVEQSLPFPIVGFDFDNGSEWLNWTLIRYLQVRTRPIGLTRSRPYHKDDNAHVEQKNWMWPRQLLGYGRLEEESLVDPINGLYREAWGPLHNFFMPSMKLVQKWRQGSRWKRRYDRPQTAYERLQASGQLKAKQRRQLRDQYEALDPFQLAASIERRLRKILPRSSGSTGKSASTNGHQIVNVTF